jgi:predicted outer membrane repeat protein
LLRFLSARALLPGVALALVVTSAVHAATITVNSLSDNGSTGICVLRDAITAANTKTATNGCTAGAGNDTINFSVIGTITLGSTLPEITNVLKIDGTGHRISVDGAGLYQVMTVNSGAALTLKGLAIANGFSGSGSGYNGGAVAIKRKSILNINTCTFSGNKASLSGDAIYNIGSTVIVTNTTFSSNSAFLGGGGIYSGEG